MVSTYLHLLQQIGVGTAFEKAQYLVSTCMC